MYYQLLLIIKFLKPWKNDKKKEENPTWNKHYDKLKKQWWQFMYLKFNKSTAVQQMNIDKIKSYGSFLLEKMWMLIKIKHNKEMWSK